MNRVGKRGMGLYAGRRFKEGDIVGRYEGNVVGTYASKDTAINSNTVKRLVRGGADKLRIMRSPEEGWDVVDGDNAPLPTLSLVNDPRGTRFNANVDVSEWAYMRCISNIPAFDLTRRLEQNIGSELKSEYGEAFWNIHERLGSREVPLEL
jgi:hypothetical protein